VFKFIPILLILCAFSTVFAYTVHSAIEYYPPGEAPQPDKNMLDVYVPDGVGSGTPVIFFIHGGTWMYNDRTDFAGVGMVLADEEEYITVIPSYRLSDSLHPGNTHPCHIEDVAQAFAWTVDNIATYNGDPSELVVIGHSAGAHLAALLSTNTYYIDEAGASVEDIQCLVSFSMGIYDIPKLYADIGMFASMGYSMMGFDRIFGPIADSTINWYDASPKYHVSADTPPTLLFVADNDMEQIIGGDFGGLGYIFLPGEIQFTYNDYNVYQPTDSFWIEGDHDVSFANFVYYPTCRARVLTMNFIEGILTDIDERGTDLPENQSINITPNPFNAACRIDAPIGANIEIFDISGAMTAQLENTDGSAVWLPKPIVPAGLYFAKIMTDSGTYTKKLTYLK